MEFDHSPEADDAGQGFSEGQDNLPEPLRPLQNGLKITADETGADAGYPAVDFGEVQPEADAEPGAAEQPEPILLFRQRFDGTQPEISLVEQKAAGSLLGQAIGELLASRGTHMLGGRSQDDSGNPLHVGVSEFVFVGVSDFKDVQLQVIKANGMGGEGSHYRLGIDGIARRIDFPDYDAMSEDERRFTRVDVYDDLDEAGTSTTEGIVDELADMHEEQAAFELATRLGLNNQPVSVEEIEQVLAIVRRTAFRDPH